MKFTDPNLFVHVRYNRGKSRMGRSLRVYGVAEANTNVKITALKVLGKLKGPAKEVLIFDDGSHVEGAGYQKLLDFLRERDMFVNCLGRILATSVLYKESQPPLVMIECLRVYDYFPWHEYGGPPNLVIDKSWVALDLKQNKVGGPGGQDRESGEKPCDDRIADLEKEKEELQNQYDGLEKRFGEEKKARDKLQQKYDQLVKKYEDITKKKAAEEDDEEIPAAYRAYLPIDNLPFETQSDLGFGHYPHFLPPQIACKNYGIFFGTDPKLVNFQHELYYDRYNTQFIKVFAYGQTYQRPFDGSTRLDFMEMHRITVSDKVYRTVAVINEKVPYCSVDASLWTRTTLTARSLVSKPGSVFWSP